MFPYLNVIIMSFVNNFISSYTLSNTINNFFTTFCNSILRPRSTTTLPFDCHCNYTKEYIDDLLWYKNYYEDLNLLFITMYIITLSGAFFLFIKNYQSISLVSKEPNEQEINFKVNNILKDLEVMNTIPEIHEFEEIPLEPENKKRKLMPIDTDYIQI